MNLNLALEENRSKKSVNKDFYQPLNFERSSMVIPVSDIDSIINTYKQFEDERNSSTKYRLNINLNPIMSNVLNNKITEVKRISDGVILTGNDRINAIQTIDDDTFDYKLGYDIFDNHFLRVDTFKTGNTLNDFTGTTLYDLKSMESAVENNLTEDNGWLCITNKSKINNVKMFSNKKACEKIDLFPTRDYFLFKPIYINNRLNDNWDYILTYPYENIFNDKLVSGSTGNGIPIINSTIVTYSGINYLQIKTVYKHGLSSNDVIKIKRNDYNTDKTYLVYDTGDINKNNESHIFLLDANKYSDLLNITGMTNNRVVRVVNKIDSNYYIRKFRKIPNFVDDLEPITVDNIENKILTGKTTFLNESFQPGFSRNIFDDSVYQIQYLDDIDINLLKDNRNRPLSEIFFTIIKKNEIDNINEPGNIFTEVLSGIDELTGTTGFSNIRLITGSTSGESALETKITASGTTYNEIQQANSFLGDIIEFNRSIVKEIKLDDISHRFNTVQRESVNSFSYHDVNSSGLFQLTGSTIGPYIEGYYYKPHYSIQLKNYSEIINTGEIPELNNCFDFETGTTFSNEIVLLSGKTDNEIKSLVLRVGNLSGLTDYDTIRITRKSDLKYINVKISIARNLKNSIIFPYDSSFMGSLSSLNIVNFVIRKYSSSDIPLYAQDMYNGNCQWREILKEGVFNNESILKSELTFTNGRLYGSTNINFYLRRQDPFGYYGLRVNPFIFPGDEFGNKVNSEISNNRVQRPNDIC